MSDEAPNPFKNVRRLDRSKYEPDAELEALKPVDKGAVQLLKKALQLAEKGRLSCVCWFGLEVGENPEVIGHPVYGTSKSLIVETPPIVVEGLLKIGTEFVLDDLYAYAAAANSPEEELDD